MKNIMEFIIESFKYLYPLDFYLFPLIASSFLIFVKIVKHLSRGGF